MEATSEVPQLDWDMVILRPTRKLNSLLPATEVIPTSSDTALGDWYVNRVVVDRQPLLLLVSSTSLLPMLIPAQNVRGLPARLAALVEARLRGCVATFKKRNEPYRVSRRLDSLNQATLACS